MVAIDTSGSISQEALDVFCGELNGILACEPASVTVLYCDAEINGVEHWEPDNGPLMLHLCGGGGTDFRPVTRWIAEQDEMPACLVYLTDGCGTYDDKPAYPVLWALTEARNVPWGRAVVIE